MQASAKGFPPAHNALGVMYYMGEAIPRDNLAAMRMFEMGARAGDVDSHYNLASMLLTGEGKGVEKDLVKGLQYMVEANRAGHWQAPFQVVQTPIY
jgi:TPR repeat protein